jgi:hypothetical protein
MPDMAPTLPISASQNKPKLLDQVRDVIRRRHFSIRTEQAYIDWIRRFILFHNKRHPREMAETEISAFLTHLARDSRVAASTQNQALSALLFLYKEILKQDIGWLRHSNRAGTPWPQGCEHNDHLHARVESARNRSQESAGLASGRIALEQNDNCPAKAR